ncbi:DNA-O6-methylguanine--protein-cysteine S-methyltransferase /transcriptional regulator Ada [Pacificibacter maritimus]|uniref:methylated-DNA--[protein]-cysteine S-methyltransferase n=1 Tax=Pacificibacter maritimus TaxID=762213 RepID=A0A3N4UQD4_9RHOB|nr:bifunctional helix-turn-helix domain-containing protein/methylated-DNA--[protein]-cysteine S-methyltransferase [Pacificibacter maritimus]RPE67197.1 DNA-O6-methylguanine--protein-cysteine S-methyltransferase /transcriptional regulator Ada [Pacificibacter maritimus]
MPVEDQYHYNVIRRAITRIDSAQRPLSLDELAKDMGMSPPHFQKIFSKWAGVSPKRYQQYLALDHAKHLMKTRHTTLGVANELGLSSSGRLHDLFLRWEAMSPGEYARQGADLEIAYGWCDTPFGEALAMATPRGLCGVAFIDASGREANLADLSARWPNAKFTQNTAKVQPYIDAAIRGGSVKLHLMGGPFQIKVWEALLSLKSGQVTTYSDIANVIGSPKAVRAVGTAVGKNPIGWLIPCHRVLRKTGALGGYHWGLETKRALLAYEAIQHDALTP